MSIKSFSVNLLILVYWSALLGTGAEVVECVRITGISDVQVMENGAPGSVVLDCQFEFDEQKDTKLILKWFQKGDNHPVYEWLISADIRRYSHKIESFVDKTFSVDDNLTRFRAIRLISPSMALSGEYECVVQSLDSHDIRTTELIVYEKADSFTMKPIKVDTGVNITCVGSGVFPEPKLSLFRIRQSNESSNSIDESQVTDNTYVRVSRQPSAKYQIVLTAQIYEDSYSGGDDVTDHYECRLVIEKTDYVVIKNLAIQPASKALSLTAFLVFPLLVVINIIADRNV